MAKTIDFDINPSGIEYYRTGSTTTVTNKPLEAISVIPEDIFKFDVPIALISKPAIKKVIFNPPATIVFFTDNTKTVVKCSEDDIFNPWAGMALCVCKKLYGSEFHKNFSKHCRDYEKEET